MPSHAAPMCRSMALWKVVGGTGCANPSPKSTKIPQDEARPEEGEEPPGRRPSGSSLLRTAFPQGGLRSAEIHHQNSADMRTGAKGVPEQRRKPPAPSPQPPAPSLGNARLDLLVSWVTAPPCGQSLLAPHSHQQLFSDHKDPPASPFRQLLWTLENEVHADIRGQKPTG